VSAEREEVIRRLALPVPDDVHLARELESERLIEGAAAIGVRDAEHRVEKASHGEILVCAACQFSAVRGTPRGGHQGGDRVPGPGRTIRERKRCPTAPCRCPTFA